MGLSERRQKQRIGNDPRNLAWRQDETGFGAQYLAKAGHTAGTSLGLTQGSGLINPIVAARKLDNSGIGVGRARKEGGTDSGSAGLAGTGLEDVLRRLRGEMGGADETLSAGSSSRVMSGFARAAEGETKDTVVVQAEDAQPVAGLSTEVAAPKPRRLAHRQKNLAAKRMANSSALALSEILGIPSSGSASPSPSLAASAAASRLGTPITSFDSPLPTPKEDGQMISTATVSVGDYFAAKMAAKKKAFEEAMRGSQRGAVLVPEVVGDEEQIIVQPIASTSAIVAAPVPVVAEEEVIVARPSEKEGKKDKGKKRKRAEQEEAASAPAPQAKELVEDAEKARKREKKERKRREKEEKTGGSTSAAPATASTLTQDDSAVEGGKKKKKRKE